MRILVLPGDGIGPEIVAAAMTVLEQADKAYGLGLAYDFDDVGFTSLEKYGTTLREDVLVRARTYDGVILGTQSHADYPAPEKGGRNVSAGFRIGLDLYANVRPARTRPFLESNLKAGKSMARGLRPSLRTHCIPAAHAAARSGDVALHNGLVAEGARQMTDCDVVMLAHFSTSTATTDVQLVLDCPVLSAPKAAVIAMRSLV